jgi:hypothetical protein
VLPTSARTSSGKSVCSRRASNTDRSVISCLASSRVNSRSFWRAATYLEIARSLTSRHKPGILRVLGLDILIRRDFQPSGSVAVFSLTPCA